MSLRLRGFPDHGFLVWFAVGAGIFAWMVHLTALAAVVGFVHDNNSFWLFHVINFGCLVVAAVAMWLSWLLYRAGDAPIESGTTGGRIGFLGALCLLVNGINILLIVVEGSYVFVIPTGR
jgi:hypothetical protein